MAATPQMVAYAKKYRPDWVCLVPEKRQELTTEGGLDVKKGFKKMAPMVEKLQRIGIEISMFIEPSLEQVEASYEVGADAVELHTGKWVHLSGPKKDKEWARLVEAAEKSAPPNDQKSAGRPSKPSGLLRKHGTTSDKSFT